jgi:hypothetical protein
MRTKIKLLFKLNKGAEAAHLRLALEIEIARLNALMTQPTTICVGMAVTDAALHVIAAGAFDATSGPYDVMLEIIPAEGALDEAAGLLTGLADRLSGLVDIEKSVALVGVEHVVLPGEGGIFVLIANRRLPHLSHAEFINYWFSFHAEFTRTHTPPEIEMRYRQFHTDIPQTEKLLSATGLGVGDFDGAAECYYPDEAALRDLMAITEIVDEATEDEVKFVDHLRCVTTVMVTSNDFGVLS